MKLAIAPRQRFNSFFFLTLLSGLLVTAFVGCGGEKPPAASISSDGADTEPSATGKDGKSRSGSAQTDPSADPIVVVQTNVGAFEITLDQEHAPLAVDNFLYNYVSRKSYDNTVVHYSSEEFLIAGGYKKDMSEVPARAAIRNESENNQKNRAATVSMSHSGIYPHSATSHFFINLADNSFFDFDETAEEDKKWGYTVFGKVTSGWEVVEKIAARPTEEKGEFARIPSDTVVIKSIRRR